MLKPQPTFHSSPILIRYPKSLREELGLSQAFFSRILGIKRDYLASVESGRLPLPASVRPILAWLEDHAALFQTPDPEPLPPSDGFHKELRKLRNEKARLEIELERRREKERQLHRTHRICEGLLQHHPSLTPTLKLWLESIGYDAGLALEILQSSPALRLQARLHGIEAEIQTLEAGIGKEQ